MIFHTIEKNGNKYRYTSDHAYRVNYGGNRFHDKKRVLFCVEMIPYHPESWGYQNGLSAIARKQINFETDFTVGDIFVGKWKIYKITWEDSIKSFFVYCEK